MTQSSRKTGSAEWVRVTGEGADMQLVSVMIFPD